MIDWRLLLEQKVDTGKVNFAAHEDEAMIESEDDLYQVRRP